MTLLDPRIIGIMLSYCKQRRDSRLQRVYLLEPGGGSGKDPYIDYWHPEESHNSG